MNKRLIGVLVFAFIVSAAASLVLYRLISARMQQQVQVPMTKLLVASRDLPIGTMVKEVDIQTADWTGKVPPNAANKTEDIVNRGVIATIYAGEPFLDTRLAGKGAGAGLTAMIPAGKRAVAVRVNDVTSVAGFVIPGSRVDILILGNPPNAPATMGTQTKTLLQNMEVLSAGQQIMKDPEGKPISVPVVNMLVTPEQAEILSLASNDSRIQLVLRNPLDTEEAKPPGTAMARLWVGGSGIVTAPVAAPGGAPRPRPAPKVAPPPPPPPKPVAKPKESFIVEIIHGASKVERKFEEEKSEEK